MKTISKILIAIILIFSVKSFAGTPSDDKTKNTNEISTPASANIEGSVVDKITGENLAGVYVEIQGTNLKTYTDLDGKFSINGLIPGNYNIIIKYISYNSSTATAAKNIQVNTGDNKSLNIEILPN